MKCKKAKWMSETSLQIAEERSEVKGKGEREVYTQLNAEFQRIVKRAKKAFLTEQGKEIEESNRMGKTRDLFQKIGNTKGTTEQLNNKTAKKPRGKKNQERWHCKLHSSH